MMSVIFVIWQHVVADTRYCLTIATTVPDRACKPDESNV